ncbi:MAG TPA: N-6 DNA methylase [Chthoniobacterales bacterium]|nr:N-6 DNA methylase [Chthoniobacterales bacterium]
MALESAQKLRGGFYTDADIADFLSRWALAKNPRRVLEPSCGDGMFISSLTRLAGSSLREIFACEMDTAEAAKAANRTDKTGRRRTTVHCGDFLRWFLFRSGNEEKFEAVVGNPPFIRYQYLPNEQQLLAEKVFARFGLPFTKHTNAWVPFVIASLSLLEPGGRLAMVIPAEILHIPHAQSLRRYLAQQCSRVLILDPDELWFENSLQGTVLLLAEKKEASSNRSHGVAIRRVEARAELRDSAEVFFTEGDYINGASIQGKWMPVFLSARERALLESLREHKSISEFGDVASVDVGIVTGANKFFLVPDAVVAEYGLWPWAHPMFGRSDHVEGMVYDLEDHAANREAGLPANFLWFDDQQESAFPAAVRRYLKTGEAEALPQRYKCRVRSPWFRVPSVYLAPVAMLKRAHHFPRLVLNKASAYTTDTAYRIRPLCGSGASLVYAFLNSLTSLSAELEGRHYGGGVLELVPSEIERLLVPTSVAIERDLRRLDSHFRKTNDPFAMLREQDQVLLRPLGLTAQDCEQIHDAWNRLRQRRQRVSSTKAQEISI